MRISSKVWYIHYPFRETAISLFGFPCAYNRTVLSHFVSSYYSFYKNCFVFHETFQLSLQDRFRYFYEEFRFSTKACNVLYYLSIIFYVLQIFSIFVDVPKNFEYQMLLVKKKFSTTLPRASFSNPNFFH